MPAGAVGTHLARLLGQEEHEITLMDADRDRLTTIRDNTDILTRQGICTSLKDLTEAGGKRRPLYWSYPEESQNITSCMLAANLGAKKTLARIDNHEYLLPKNTEFFEKLGIHSMIYPELIAAREIAMALKTPWTRFWWELCNGTVILVGAKVRENAPIVNKYLHELIQESKQFHMVAIKRDNRTIIPKGNDQVMANDILYFATLRKHVQVLPELLGKKLFETKRIIIMGGSRITMRTIQQLPQSTQIKIVEQDRERAERLVEVVPPNVTVFV